MNRIVDVDLARRNVSELPAPDDYRVLGGRGLTSTILSRELNPSVHPLGPDNLLVFAPGLLAGSPLSSCSRFSAGAKSPLTGTLKESNCGGVVGGLLGRLGIKAMVIRGAAKPGSTLVLRVTGEKTEILEMDGLRGRTIYSCADILSQEFGKKAGLVINGPAGEMRLPTACLSATDAEGEPCRNLGRGGLGAVAGSKGIKALVIDAGDARLEAYDPDGLRDLSRRFTKALRDHPTTGELFAKYGTTMTLMRVNSLGGLPTRNYSAGAFEYAEKIGGEALHKTIAGRGGQYAHGCMRNCVIRCSNKYVDEEGRPVVGSVDFETVCLMGANLGISDLDAIAKLNRLCNEIGVDTMETGAVLGVLGEAGVFEFGDAQAVLDIVSQIGSGTPLGRLVGSGAQSCGRAYGVLRVPVVKGQGMAAYDPRAIKGLGLTYAMSPMGADHTAGNAITLDVDHLDPSAQLDPVRELHARTMVLDTLGACIFTGRVSLATPEFLEEAVRTITGQLVSFEELSERGMDLLRMERDFNRLAGFNEAHDRLPEFMRTEPLSPTGSVYDIAEEDHRRFYATEPHSPPT